MESLFDQEQWMSSAACRNHPNMEMWFSEKREDIAESKAICGDCPVRTECLDYALTWRINWGVWGGLDDKERKRVQRRAFWRRKG